MPLFDFQSDAVLRSVQQLHRCPLVVSPTGSGKTTMGAEIVRRVNMPTLWIAHREELILQAAKRLREFGLSAGIIKAGHDPEPRAVVQVASIQTLVRRRLPTVGLIVVDEAHHICGASYQEVIEAYPGIPRVGLTATPFRLDGRGLGDTFGTIIVAAYTDELCEQGLLHAPRVWASSCPDLRGVKVVAGEYQQGQMAERAMAGGLIGDVVDTWITRASGRYRFMEPLKTVVFAINVEHSKAIRDRFVERGIMAEHVDGTTPADARKAALQKLADGTISVLCNCQVLTEGWDLPSLECAVVARPTASLNLHLQMIGRIMRACPGKSGCIVLDHAGNHLRHGLVTRRLEYTLRPDCGAGAQEPIGLRRCEACLLVFQGPSKECPECGHINEPRVRKIRTYTGELVEYSDTPFHYRQQAFNALDAQRQAAGYKEGWTAIQYKQQFGVWPLVIDGELVDARDATEQQKARHYYALLAIQRKSERHPQWATYVYKSTFGEWPKRRKYGNSMQ